MKAASRPVSVIVLNYNGASMALRAVAAQIAEAKSVHPDSELIFVDNASTDGSADAVERKFPKVRVLRMKKNSFLHSFNDALKVAKNDTVILINNDMIPQKGCFSRLVSSLGPDVFAVGPKILFPGKERINFAFAMPKFWLGFFAVGRPGMDELDRGQCDVARPIESLYPPIASAFDKKKLVAIGGFDPLYDPAYWEDVDLGYSAWKRGWRTLYDSKAVTIHDHQRTIEKGNKKSAVSYWINKNKHLFIIKNVSDNWMRGQYVVALPFIVIAGTLRHGLPFLSGFVSALGHVAEALFRNSQEERHRKLSDREIFRRTGGKL